MNAVYRCGYLSYGPSHKRSTFVANLLLKRMAIGSIWCLDSNRLLNRPQSARLSSHPRAVVHARTR